MKVYRSVHLIFGGKLKREEDRLSIHPSMRVCSLRRLCVWTPVVSVGMRKQQCEADELVTRKNEELAVTLHLSTELEVQVTSMSYDSQPLQCRSVLQPKPAETCVWLNRCGSLNEDTHSSDSCAWIHVCGSVRFTRHMMIYSDYHSEHAVTSSLYCIWTWSWTVHTSRVWLFAL